MSECECVSECVVVSVGVCVGVSVSVSVCVWLSSITFSVSCMFYYCFNIMLVYLCGNHWI